MIKLRIIKRNIKVLDFKSVGAYEDVYKVI